MSQAYIYFLTNWTGKVLYIGVTNHLERRVLEHKQKLVDGFSKRYSLDRLVYYETCSDIEDAIRREKQLKGWSRPKKNGLVESMNPEWIDLSEGWFEDPSTALGMTDRVNT